MTDPQVIIDSSIAFHGLEGFDNKAFSLNFRNIGYTYQNNNGIYTYTRLQTDSTGAKLYDVLTNDGLKRYQDDNEVEPTNEKRAAYARSVNSVIYFFRLPFGLNDPAVIKQYNGVKEIKGKSYHEIEITFEETNGGEDYDDVFLYWFDQKDFSMDYLAYLYHTEGGGIRFREAINQRDISGSIIQDYINFKPENEDIGIYKIRELYNKGQLIELSRIINENVMIQ
jgi:hypothetical protein